MDPKEMVNAIEAMLFAAGGPLTLTEIRHVYERLQAGLPEAERQEVSAAVNTAVTELKAKWSDPEASRGFQLVDVAEGISFRTNVRYAAVLRAMREERPVRLSKAALETLAIIAYRQPVTKPEMDHVRGVDCTATLHLLLERNLVRMVGKKQEPGLPTLYGTSKEFLSFFNISNLAQLPTLQEYHELSDESRAEVDELEAQLSLKDLSESAKKLKLDEEPAVLELESAVSGLKETESRTRESLAAQGIALQDEAGDEPVEPGPGEPEAVTPPPPAKPD
ncbi:MAG: SMC-Scp complex subunit ScpB [Deltaproteobacteria bacterium]|nr:SMC-Scp complex subunit ScpB [Deltaproteobacteria bacterium]